MEPNKLNSITSRQASLFIVAAQTGIGILLLPSAVTRYAGHSGWISVLIGGVPVFFGCLMIISLCNRFNGSSILTINTTIFGKHIGFFLNLIIVLSFIFITASQFLLFVSIVGTWFFKSTPLWVLAIYLVIPSVYITAKGLKAICRFNFLLFLFIPIILSLIPLNLQNFRFTQLLPLEGHGLMAILSGVPATAIAFSGFEVLLLIFPYITNKKNLRKYVSAATISTTLIFTIIVIVAIAVFGENLLVKRVSTISGLARMIRLPVFERVDLYYFAIWISGMLLVLNSYCFISTNSLKQIFRIKNKYLSLLIITVIKLSTAFFISDTNVQTMLFNISSYIAMVIGIFIPIVLLLISIITKKKGGKAVEKTS